MQTFVHGFAGDDFLETAVEEALQGLDPLLGFGAGREDLVPHAHNQGLRYGEHPPEFAVLIRKAKKAQKRRRGHAYRRRQGANSKPVADSAAAGGKSVLTLTVRHHVQGVIQLPSRPPQVGSGLLGVAHEPLETNRQAAFIDDNAAHGYTSADSTSMVMTNNVRP